MRYLVSRLLFALVLIILSQCALTNIHHLSTTNYLDRHIVPDDNIAQWAMTPVLIPTTIVSLVVDNLLVAPIAQLPSATVNTIEFNEIDIDGYYANRGIIPFKVVLTPFVFVGAWLGRTIYSADIDRDAWWGWPKWGIQWSRDQDGKLINKEPELNLRETGILIEDNNQSSDKDSGN